MIFQTAAEAHTIGAPLIQLFVTGLGRVPHQADLGGLVRQRRGGASLAGLATGIAGSSEFLARHGPDGPPGVHYVRSLFWAIDGEDVDDSIIAQLLGRPDASRASLLLAVSQSERAREHIDLTAMLYPNGLPPEDDVAYQLWLDEHPDEPGDQVAMARHAATLRAALFSIIVIVPPARPDLVQETVAALSAQGWPHWECLLACPDGLPAHVQAAAAALARQVPAVRLVAATAGCSRAQAVNQALAEASGAMIGWIDASDRLSPAALQEAAAVLADHPDALLTYTDEDRIAGDGTRAGPVLKPGWSIDLALAADSFGQLTLFARDAALAHGGFATEAAPFERYDLALRLALAAAPGQVHHVPAILFHGGRLRPAAPSRVPAVASQPKLGAVIARRLQQSQLGLSRGERSQGHRSWPALAATLPDPAPRISVIVPTRDRAELLERCLEGLLRQTDYPALEVLILDNGSTTGETLALLQRAQHDPRVRVLPQPGPFNWSALNNAGAAAATGDILLLLNNDIEVVEPGWLAAIAGHVMRPDVGVVGARLVFPDGRLQHGGVLLGPRGQAIHAMTYAEPGQGGYLGQVALARDLSAVTGACLAIRRAVFNQVGGLESARLRVGWGDIDLCLRVRAAGYRVLYLPQAVLVHHEMATRGRDESLRQQARHETERSVLRRRWPKAMDQDPFLNPNLEAAAASIVLAQPPRRVPPWLLKQEAAA